ncbi:MAG: lyase family protein, partial [Acidimicrobiia bacterium]|nr:lyase family protein [Acidimicrobiia bacterium]MDX2467855.1 lyase family protein [Acidimicrobiia bacterium]
DLRWLSSGPRTGIAEIQLPSLQPGSSIMPGKVNPVMSEMVMQVAAQVMGNDAAVTWGGANGNFELNVMMPVIAHNLLESISLLAAAAVNFTDKCVVGVVANVERSRELVEKNIIVVTALNPHIGYDNGAIAAKEAFASGRNVADVVVEKGWLTVEQVTELLDIKRMTEGGVIE